MKKINIILLLLLLSSFLNHAYSQENDQTKKKEFWHRFSVGGNLGLQFGTVTAVMISPEVTFRAVDQLYFGLGFSYEYIWYKDYFYDTRQRQYLDFTRNIWGGRIFSRYYLRSIFSNEILGNLFAHLEYEYLTYKMPYVAVAPGQGDIIDPFLYYYKPGNEIKEINSIFVGGGYQQPLGKRFFMDILVLYNLNDTYDSPYSNPIIRIGFGSGL